MTDKPYFLSICIPTYCRHDYLKKTVDSLIKQIGILNSTEVQICISDNCSNDNTNNYLNVLTSHTFIKTNRNLVNCGYDYNLMKAFEMCEGEYIWFLSDDDIITDKTVNSLITILKGNKPNSVFLKPVFFRGSPVEKDYQFGFDMVEKADDALKRINWLVSFLSSFIVKKSLIKQSVKDFFGSGFIHTPLILEVLSYGSVAVVEEGFLFVRQGNSGGYNKYQFFGPNFEQIINSFFGVFTAEAIEKTLYQWASVVIVSNIVEDKKKKKFKFSDYLLLKKAYKKHPKAWKCIKRASFALAFRKGE